MYTWKFVLKLLICKFAIGYLDNELENVLIIFRHFKLCMSLTVLIDSKFETKVFAKADEVIEQDSWINNDFVVHFCGKYLIPPLFVIAEKLEGRWNN